MKIAFHKFPFTINSSQRIGVPTGSSDGFSILNHSAGTHAVDLVAALYAALILVDLPIAYLKQLRKWLA